MAAISAGVPFGDVWNSTPISATMDTYTATTPPVAAVYARPRLKMMSTSISR